MPDTAPAVKKIDLKELLEDIKWLRMFANGAGTRSALEGIATLKRKYFDEARSADKVRATPTAALLRLADTIDEARNHYLDKFGQPEQAEATATLERIL